MAHADLIDLACPATPPAIYPPTGPRQGLGGPVPGDRASIESVVSCSSLWVSLTCSVLLLLWVGLGLGPGHVPHYSSYPHATPLAKPVATCSSVYPFVGTGTMLNPLTAMHDDRS